MRQAMLIGGVMGALAVSGCAARIVQDVTVKDDALIVKECILENGGTFDKKCVERVYQLSKTRCTDERL